MSWSRVAFGAARCVFGVPEHEAALRRALQNGITVVDTGAHYTGGASEKMVGEVLHHWRSTSKSGDQGEGPIVVSKFGYAPVDVVQGAAAGWYSRVLLRDDLLDLYHNGLQGLDYTARGPPSSATNMTLSCKANSNLPGLIPIAPGLSHSLHPDFYRNELSGSLQRLKGAALSTYLMEHPEHHLSRMLGLRSEGEGSNEEKGKDGHSSPSQAELEDARGKFYEKMTSLFEALEERVQENGNLAYGVSSVGFSLPPSDPMHVSWEALVKCAEQAASKAGREKHAFGVIQMPANLLETTGLAVAPAMQKAGLKVMACHPLRAATPEGKFLLVDDALRGGLPADYMDVCREVLEHFNLEIPNGREPTEEEEEIRQGCRFLQQLVQDMNAQLTVFTSLEHYEAELAGSITPMIADKFEALDETSADLLQAFFERYGKMVRYSSAQRVRDMVASGLGCSSGAHTLEDGEPLQRYAVRWLLDQAGVTCAVVGMEQAEYVDAAVSAMLGASSGEKMR